MSDRKSSNHPTCLVRRGVLAVTALATLYGAHTALAQGTGSEAALRETIAQYEQAWNRHDVKAWASFLTADVAYTDVYALRRVAGRDAAIARYGYTVEPQDLKWVVVRGKMLAGDTATVVMRTEFGVLPFVNGKYKTVFKDFPAISRWRVEGGQWRMSFFTSFSVRGAEIVKSEGLE